MGVTTCYNKYEQEKVKYHICNQSENIAVNNVGCKTIHMCTNKKKGGLPVSYVGAQNLHLILI